MTQTSILVHDYLTQRGGAERVVLSLARLFPGAPIYTSFYDPTATFPEFADLDVRVSRLNALRFLRRRHRLALPFLAPTFSHLKVDADITVCSTSGWAHGIKASGRKVVYCHAPARWLYQREAYLKFASPPARVALKVLTPSLRQWDRSAAESADLYIANSRHVSALIRENYGIEAIVIPPPHRLDPDGDQRRVPGLSAGFFLCISRLLSYKNVDSVLEAFRRSPEDSLVIVGQGPLGAQLRQQAPGNTTFLGAVDDDQLRWLYARCQGVVAAAFEDFGLTPLEAACFGKPSAVLRKGGYLDTVAEGTTGVFFSQSRPADIAQAIKVLTATRWSSKEIREHAGHFSEEVFLRRMTAVLGGLA